MSIVENDEYMYDNFPHTLGWLNAYPYIGVTVYYLNRKELG